MIQKSLSIAKAGSLGFDHEVVSATDMSTKSMHLPFIQPSAYSDAQDTL